jgi:glycosyltransferase involved in cell wall biosynthesis
MAKTFCVAVPFFNEEALIRRCVEGALAQDYDPDDYEIVFVDNASTDRSAAIVAEYPRIKLLRETQKGPYACRNRAIASTDAKVIAFTDGDRAPAPDWLSRIKEGMDRTGADFALGAVYFPPPRGPAHLLADYDNEKMRYILERCPPEYYFGSTGNMAVRREVFERFGPFVEWERGGDTEIVHRYLKGTPEPRVVYLPDMAVTHLEMKGVGDWMRKIRTYGTSIPKVERMYPHRPLTFGMRMDVWRRCAKAGRYGAGDALALLGLLALGSAHYYWGRFRGRKGESYA